MKLSNNSLAYMGISLLMVIVHHVKDWSILLFIGEWFYIFLCIFSIGVIVYYIFNAEKEFKALKTGEEKTKAVAEVLENYKSNYSWPTIWMFCINIGVVTYLYVHGVTLPILLFLILSVCRLVLLWFYKSWLTSKIVEGYGD